MKFNLLDDNTPLVFSDGSKVYEELAREFKTHNTGYFILAPSGAGKTHFINAQQTKDWMDGDTLWMATNAHPEGSWWLKPLAEINEIERRSDVITTQAKKLGFWLMGTDCYSIPPDAVVIPDWETHKKFIAKRESDNYDGGATSEQLDGVLRARKYMESFKEKGVPVFESIEEAAEFLANKS